MTNRIGKLCLVAAFALMASTAVSYAQENPCGTPTNPCATPPPGDPNAPPGEPEPKHPTGAHPTKADYPIAVIDRPLQVVKGMIEIAGNTVNVNLSTDAVGKPVFVAPTVYYGITDFIAAGVFHSIGLCLTGTDNGCFKTYQDVGVDFRYYPLHHGNFLLSAHAGVQFLFLDEVAMSALVGAYMQYVITPKIAILFDPTVNIKLKDVGNSFAIPVWFGYQANPNIWVFLFTAFGGPFDGFGDAFTGSLGLGGNYAISNMMDLGLEFQFTNLYGKGGGADGRLLIARFAIRL